MNACVYFAAVILAFSLVVISAVVVSWGSILLGFADVLMVVVFCGCL